MFGLYFSALAQNSTENSTWGKYYIKYNNPMYVIDGKSLSDSLAKHVLDKSDPYSFVKISILHASSPNQRNVVYITTDIVKIKAYQKKLGTFSKEYKNYLEVNQSRDDRFHYFINGTMLEGYRTDMVNKLDSLPAEKITDVEFKLNDQKNQGLTMVFIKTKK